MPQEQAKEWSGDQSNIIIRMMAGKKSRAAHPAMAGKPSTIPKMKPMPSQWATIPKNPLSGLGRNKSFIVFFG